MNLGDLVKDAVGSILDRDLQALRREVEAYPAEADLWRVVPGITNSAGTLTLHLAGNLQHFFGARLGRTGYVRDRPAEFSRRVERAELFRQIEAAQAAVRTGLASLAPSQLTVDFPEVVVDARLITGEYLVHLITHFAYHLGQIDYHRRFVTGSEKTIGAVRPGELSSARPVAS